MEVEVIKKKEGILDSKGNIRQGKVRVAAYARVSTDHDEQQSSFESQQKYYLDKITTNPKWAFVEVYADEGISGTQAYKRENFMRMIRDAEEGKLDLILTKSISRFARNTLDTLKYVRLLRNKNIGIIFEEENINTMDMAGELLLTVLSSVAQQESETISSHIRLGFKMKRERGELIGFNSCYGYEFSENKKDMLIKEDEAKIVRKIYAWYLDGYGSSSIAKMLTQMGITSPSGLDHWGETTVSNILTNEKYIGDVCQGKSFTVDAVTHRRLPNRGEEDKYYMKDHHEPIISREDFQKVADILKSRNKNHQTGRKVYTRFTFSGMLRCGFCGKVYGRKSLYKKRPAWDCLSVIKDGRELCPNSKLMHEDVIRSCFMEAYSLLTKDNGIVIEDFMQKVREAIKDKSPSQMKSKYEKQIDSLKKKVSKLVDLYVEEKVPKEVFEKKHMDLQNEIDAIQSKVGQLSTYELDSTQIDLSVDKIKYEIQARETSNEIKLFDEEVFKGLVDYAIIGAYDEIGNKEPYVIRFICKKGFNSNSRDDITEEKIVDSNHLGSDESIYVPIIDFVSNQHFFVYDKVSNGNRLTKKLVTKVRVRLEVEK